MCYDLECYSNTGLLSNVNSILPVPNSSVIARSVTVISYHCSVGCHHSSVIGNQLSLSFQLSATYGISENSFDRLSFQ